MQGQNRVRSTYRQKARVGLVVFDQEESGANNVSRLYIKNKSNKPLEISI